MSTSADELQSIYRRRFARNREYRQQLWRVLTTEFFQPMVHPQDAVLDLGCGYGEFINQVNAREKFGLDLNPDSATALAPEVRFFHQDCSQPWPLPDQSLKVVFTSNFLEHLPDKPALGRTLDQARRCLKPGGRFIAMGPNIKFLPGAYWDFWDHSVPLTEAALGEALESRGLSLRTCHARFLPYTMARGPQYPLLFLRVYLKLPLFWRFLGKQFLVIAEQPA